MNKLVLPVLFFLLAIINLLIYRNREQFAYTPYSTVASLYAPCDQACSRTWKQWMNDFPSEQQQEAAHLLTTRLQLNGLSTREKTLLIANFLYSRFHGQEGHPSDKLLQSDPIHQFRQLESSDSIRLWCSNYVAMLNYFCWTQQITCRTIEIMKPGDRHVVSEVYLPESSQWALVDITNNYLMIQDEEQKPLNVHTFIQALKKKNTLTYLHSGEKAVFFTDTLSQPPLQAQRYFKPEYPLNYYYHVYSKEVFSPSSKLKRYITRSSYYTIYHEGHHQQNHFLFYTKLFFFYGWIVVLFLWMIQLLVRRKKSKLHFL